MARYAKYSKNCELLAIGENIGGTEITESEYNALLAEIREKADLVDKLYGGSITIADVPTDWQAEIQRRVDERIAADGEAGEASDEIDPDEAVSAVKILLGMEE